MRFTQHLVKPASEMAQGKLWRVSMLDLKGRLPHEAQGAGLSSRAKVVARCTSKVRNFGVLPSLPALTAQPLRPVCQCHLWKDAGRLKHRSCEPGTIRSPSGRPRRGRHVAIALPATAVYS